MRSDQVDKRAVEMTHDDTVALHAPAENAVIAGIGDDRALEAMRALLKEQHAWTGSCGLNEGCIPSAQQRRRRGRHRPDASAGVKRDDPRAPISDVAVIAGQAVAIEPCRDAGGIIGDLEYD